MYCISFACTAKLPAVPPRRAYGYATEFNTAEQLENIELDVDAMRVQSLLICDRVLGLGHKDSLFRLMFRGASYADSLRFQRCIELWQLALETRVQRFTILYSDTCFTAQALVRLMLDLYDRHFDVAANEIAHRDEPMFEDVMTVLELLTAEILGAYGGSGWDVFFLHVHICPSTQKPASCCSCARSTTSSKRTSIASSCASRT